ncbi:MAG: precorrin-8X methylmutase [Nitrospinae bacterium]|nr:precorrin-8X methylmutase [Nitrospinota bacterium]
MIQENTTGARKKRALIHALYESPIGPEEIEAMSFAAIDREAPSHNFPPDEWLIARRMIHTTANFTLAGALRFSKDAICSAVKALRAGAAIYSDSNMIKSGVSVARLQSVNANYTKEKIVCHVADADVAAESKNTGLPRSLFAARKAKDILNGGVALFGNAPVALMELNRLILEEGVRPALVVAMPVGFVHVVESKEELMSLGVPYIALEGRLGGSPLAVSVIHSLCALAVADKEVAN